MISLSDVLKAKELNSSNSNLENIYLALIKLEWSSNDLANNLNNTNVLLSGNLSSKNNFSEYALVKDSGLIEQTQSNNRHFVDQKESIIMQTLRLLCQPSGSKANAPYQGPYAYLPGKLFTKYVLFNWFRKL